MLDAHMPHPAEGSGSAQMGTRKGLELENLSLCAQTAARTFSTTHRQPPFQGEGTLLCSLRTRHGTGVFPVKTLCHGLGMGSTRPGLLGAPGPEPSMRRPWTGVCTPESHPGAWEEGAMARKEGLGLPGGRLGMEPRDTSAFLPLCLQP